MKKQNRNDGYLALRDEPDEQRIRYSELLMMMKHKMPITKDDKKFVKTKIAKLAKGQLLPGPEHLRKPPSLLKKLQGFLAMVRIALFS